MTPDRLEHLTPEQIQLLIARLPEMPLAERVALLEDLEQRDLKQARRSAREDFLVFCHRVYPGFKEGPHHRHLKPLLHDMAATWSNTEETPPHALRLTVSMPPRFGKSESIAFLYVAWYLGHNPKHQILMITHTADLSESFGKKVRDLLDSAEYQAIFEHSVQVSKDKSAAGNWTTVQGGVYLALGVGANVAGKGADLLVADDLVSEQAVLYGNPTVAFETAWSYMQVGPLQRLMPGGRIVMIGCLTAETRVLLADGGEKEIKGIRAGDKIATYEDGRLSTSEVTNWIEHRPDKVYKIRTVSGKIVRANERHPFLVDRNGSREWVRVRNLKVGDCMVQAVPQTDAGVSTRPKDCARFATSESCTQTGALAHNGETGTGANGAVSPAAQEAALNPPGQRGCARLATTVPSGVQASTASRKSRSARAISNTVMAFLRWTTTLWSRVRAVSAQYASALQQQRIHVQDKSRSSTLITATTQTGSGGCSATTATWPSATQALNNASWPLPDTYATTPDPIAEILADGSEPVYDIEVARTENFIANGLVSHNTRWGKQDPIAKAIQWSKDKKADGALPWHEVRFPAVMDVERDGVMQTVSLWPEQWPLKELMGKKAGMRPAFWAAQYMQEPTSDSVALIKREYWKIWPGEEPPEIEVIIQVWDTAHETKTKSDYSACTTFGVWFNEESGRNELMLLNALKDRWEFPELKKQARAQAKEWEPDHLLVEKKAAGAPLIQELRAMELFVEEYSPSRGRVGHSNDKYARVSAISAVFEDGCVWMPDTKWAREVREECADYPNGDHDDYVDCVTMACMRFRQGGYLRLSSDPDEDDNEPTRPPVAAYY